MSAFFEQKVGTGPTEREVALYYEDDKIALNTKEVRSAGYTSYHEVMLDRPAVQSLIEALTTMQADITTRYQQKAIEA